MLKRMPPDVNVALLRGGNTLGSRDIKDAIKNCTVDIVSILFCFVLFSSFLFLFSCFCFGFRYVYMYLICFLRVTCMRAPAYVVTLCGTRFQVVELYILVRFGTQMYELKPVSDGQSRTATTTNTMLLLLLLL